jgi:hypothetical protein
MSEAPLNILYTKYTQNPKAFIEDVLLYENPRKLLRIAYVGWKIFEIPSISEELKGLLPEYGFKDLADEIDNTQEEINQEVKEAQGIK